MSTNSKIEWTNKTWNPIAGCTKVSAGCLNCYAETEAARVLLRVSANAKSDRGLETVEAYTRAVDPKRRRWTGKVGLMHGKLADPLKWREPAMVFVNSMSDLFHPDVPFDFVDQVFAVMALCPQHTFQVLTKRPERMAEYAARYDSNGYDTPHRIEYHMVGQSGCDGAFSIAWPLPNVWLGTSVEDQKTADERIPHLLKCPAAVRWLSMEPLLGPVDLALDSWWHPEYAGALQISGRYYLGGSWRGVGPRRAPI